MSGSVIDGFPLHTLHKLCVTECVPVPDQMSYIAIWHHWLIFFFLAASCNQQELTGRWENTARVLHCYNVPLSAYTAFVQSTRAVDCRIQEWNTAVFHCSLSCFIYLFRCCVSVCVLVVHSNKILRFLLLQEFKMSLDVLKCFISFNWKIYSSMQQSEISHHFFRVCFQQGLPVIFIVVPFYEQPFRKTHDVFR